MNKTVGSLLLAIAIAGCGGGGTTENAAAISGTPTSSSAPVAAATPASTSTPDPASSPTPASPSSSTIAIHIGIEGSGSVEDPAADIACATSCVAQVTTGTTVNLIAKPAADARFDGWTGACSGVSVCVVSAQTAASVAAVFVSNATSTGSAGLFDSPPAPGYVVVTLHPGSQVVLGQPTRVAFGVPLPRNLVTSLNLLRLTTDAGDEIVSAVSELARWRTIAVGGAESIRSALFYADVTFAQRSPQTIRVQFGVLRTQNLNATQPAVTALWTDIANGPVPDEYPAANGVHEPNVYATLPADWLGRTLLRSRVTPVNPNGQLAWWDTALTNYARTAVNDVAATVSAANRINLIAEEPWLYDRALSLFNVYIRTGDVNWLRRAHRAAQWYASRIGTNGIFTLSSYSADLKYSYGMSMLVDFLVTGDISLRTPIERVAQAGVREWQASYSANMGFWTERHHAYALLAALSAFEMTGDRTHAQRATALMELTLSMSNNAAKCPLHTVEQHEGDAGDLRQMCSPWMNALLAEAMLRYYILSEDQRVLQWLSGMGDYVRQYAMYDGGLEAAELSGKKMAWYMAGPGGQIEDGRGWDDMEHACDVAGLMAKSVWAKQQLAVSATGAHQTATDLLATCEYVLGYWHRTTPTLAEYRLTPPRKFSWWFGSSSDLNWLLGQ